MSFSSNRFGHKQRRRHHRFKRLRLERLEARRVLATYFVTTTDDNSFGICVADNPGASIDCSIRSAISAAESNPGPDTISIPDGVYLLEEGSLDVFDSDNLNLVGNADAPENVVIDGQQSRVFDLLPEIPISVSFTGLTIQNGVADDGSGGGGINAGSADLIVDHSIIQDNRADFDVFFGGTSSGGGIQASGNVTITNSQLLNNDATEHGGAIAFQPFLENRSLQITDTTIAGNSAEIDGGGIYVESGDVDASVSIGRSTIENNDADDSGGGVFVLDTDVTVFESTFRLNSALGTDGADGVGGGFYLRSASGNEAFEIRETAFEDNRSAGGGGGAIMENSDGTMISTTFDGNGITRPGSGPNLFAEGGGGFVLLGLTRLPSVVADELTVTNNFAPAGGGIAVVDTNFTVTGSTVSANRATNPLAGGGGIGAIGTTPAGISLDISDSTFGSNTTEGEGAGIGAIDADLTLKSVVVQQNSALGGRAGGIGILGSGRVPVTTIQQSTIQDNQASTDGGGIYAPGPLTIDQTVVSGNSVGSGSGGGIYLGTGDGSTGSLLVTDSTISANNAAFAGGGVRIDPALGPDIEARFVDTTIDGNGALEGGAGIRSSGMPIDLLRGSVSNNVTDQGIESDGGGISMSGDLTIRETTFVSNIARDFGGAVFYDGGTLDVADNTFSGNQAGDGGGAFYMQPTPDIDAIFARVLFELNASSFGGGGAIKTSRGDFGEFAVTTVDTTFSENSAADGGGAIDSDTNQLTLQRTTFTENIAAGDGGAVRITDGTAVVENSTFSANRADGSGGGMFVSGVSATLVELVHATFTLNDAQSGGGIVQTGPSLIETGNSVVAANTATISDPDVSGTFSSNDGNFIGDIGDASGLTGTLDQVGPGANGPLDPQLGPLLLQNPSDNTPTHEPLSGSPLIDAAGGIVSLANDQREVTRPIDGDGDSIAVADIGAVEAEEVLAGDPDLAVVKSANSETVLPGGVVRFTLNVSNLGAGPATGVTVQDVLPSGLTFVEGSGTGGSYSEDNGTVTIAVGSVAPGAVQSLQFTATVAVSASGDLVNTATVSAVEIDSDLTNNQSSVTLAVVATAGNTVRGHLFCDANGNVQEDPGEQLAGVAVFVDVNGNQARDPQELFAITDVNGDYVITGVSPGQVDVVTSLPSGCNTISPKPPLRTTLGVGDLARSIAAVDLDFMDDTDNGFMDLVVANDLSSDLTVLRNDGGSFSIADRIPLSERPQSVTVWQQAGSAPTYAVAAVGTTESKGKVFLIEPTGTTAITVGDGPVQVVMEDFNEDGRPDLLTSAFRSSDLHLIMGGSGEPIQLTTGRNVLGSAVGDFNGDGRKDIVVGGAGFGGDVLSEIKVLLGNGDGTFREGPFLSVAKNVVQLTGVDLDGDGTDEILALAKSGSLVSLRLQPNMFGASELAVISSTALERGANAFAVGSFNQDDLLDVAVTNLDQESVEILVGAGDGRFVSVSTTTNIPSPSDVVVADFNGDDVGDVAVANLFARSPDQTSRFRLPSTATILQFDIASETIFLSSNTVATVDFAFSAANPELLLDVNGDMALTPADALAVINALNRTSLAEGEQVWSRFQRDTDVNRDGATTPLDALLIINRLNQRERVGEGEASLLTVDYESEEARRRREQERALAVDAVLTQLV